MNLRQKKKEKNLSKFEQHNYVELEIEYLKITFNKKMQSKGHND